MTNIITKLITSIVLTTLLHTSISNFQTHDNTHRLSELFSRLLPNIFPTISHMITKTSIHMITQLIQKTHYQHHYAKTPHTSSPKSISTPSQHVLPKSLPQIMTKHIINIIITNVYLYYFEFITIIITKLIANIIAKPNTKIITTHNYYPNNCHNYFQSSHDHFTNTYYTQRISTSSIRKNIVSNTSSRIVPTLLPKSGTKLITTSIEQHSHNSLSTSVPT